MGNAVKLHINPGDGQTFPWLSRLAANFEYYIVNSMSISYEPTVSHTTTGGIVLSCEYDPAAPEPGSLSEYLNKATSIKGQVAQYCTLVVNPSKVEKHIRTSHSASTTSSNMRHMDAGVISTLLYNISSQIDHDYGELSVKYDITLLRPSLSSASIKCHQHTVSNINEDYGGATYHPALGTFINNTPAYHGEDESTLGVTISTRDDILRAGFQCVSSRLHFEEPFTGRLTVRTDPLTGLMNAPPSLFHTNSLTRNATDDAPSAYHSIVKAAGTIAQGVMVAMDVRAKAGDILDLIWDQANTYITDNATLELMELAGPLLLAI